MTNGSPSTLALSNVDLIYDGPPSVQALRAVNFELRHGEFVGIVGPSGAGKSSLLHVLGLLTTPTSGQVLLNGTSVENSCDDDLTRIRGRDIGFVFQAFHLLEGRSVLENVALPLRYQGVSPGRARILAESAIQEVGLEYRVSAKARTLSGGERQRVAIARALVGDPAVLLCDEPTGNLDSTNSDNIMRLLQKLNDHGRTILVITCLLYTSDAADE